MNVSYFSQMSLSFLIWMFWHSSAMVVSFSTSYIEKERQKKAICLVIFFFKLRSNHLCLFCFCLKESLTLELCLPCWCIWAEVIYFSTPHKRTCAQAAQSRLQFINLHYVINLRWPAMTLGHHLLTKSTSQAAIFLISPLQYRFFISTIGSALIEFTIVLATGEDMRIIYSQVASSHVISITIQEKQENCILKMIYSTLFQKSQYSKAQKINY